MKANKERALMVRGSTCDAPSRERNVSLPLACPAQTRIETGA
jgi:hypothetical protein